MFISRKLLKHQIALKINIYPKNHIMGNIHLYKYKPISSLLAALPFTLLLH